MRILYTCICIYWRCIDIHMSRTYKHFMVNAKKLPYLLYMREYAYNKGTFYKYELYVSTYIYFIGELKLR